MTTLALYNNKGGVGKTTSAVNLAYLSAHDGRSTLICDLDPQSSATYYFRVKPKLKKKAREFENKKPLERSIKGTDFEGLDLLPADFTHRNLDIAFHGHKHSKERLSQVLKPYRKEYDLIFIDTPPTLNIVAENVFHAADILLVPLIPTTLSLRAYGQLLAFLGDSGFRPDSVLAFFSMVDRRKKMHNDLMKEAVESFPGVLPRAIPDLALIEKMGVERRPVPEYAPYSTAARAYEALWAAVKERVGL
ncbi:MAG: AAA family ATPase [Anaerolineales bacterium]|nr:AAA family ATPase [Anaerolineales bacterium]